MSESKPLKFYSRSHAVADWKCPRFRYLGYEFGGLGLTDQGLALELFLGTAIHDGLAAIATATKTLQDANVEWTPSKIDIDHIASTLGEQVYETLLAVGDVAYAKEQSTLIEGLLRGFYKHVWPRLLAEYPQILAVEGSLLYRHDAEGLPDPDGPFGFMSKPDLLMLNPTSGKAIYIEYKSTSSKKEEWINSWTYAVQLHSTVQAVSSALDVELEEVQVVGLYKGYFGYGKQSSIFCYGYRRNAQPPFMSGEVSYEYKPGFKRVPVWELPGGIKEWVDNMPAEVLVDQFPITPPILINLELVGDFFKQRAIREFEIVQALHVIEAPDTDPEMRENYLNAFFPQKFDQCRPPYGKACPFLRVCFGGAELDPSNPPSGYDWRESHHEIERDHLTEKES